MPGQLESPGVRHCKQEARSNSDPEAGGRGTEAFQMWEIGAWKGRRSFSQGAHFWVGEGGTLVFGDISYISHGLNSFWEYNESIKTNITFRGCTRGYNIPKFSHQDR